MKQFLLFACVVATVLTGCYKGEKVRLSGTVRNIGMTLPNMSCPTELYIETGDGNYLIYGKKNMLLYQGEHITLTGFFERDPSMYFKGCVNVTRVSQ